MRKVFIVLSVVLLIGLVNGQVFADGSTETNAIAGAQSSVSDINPSASVSGINSSAEVSDISPEANIIDNSTKNVYDRKFVTPGITPIPQTGTFTTAPAKDSSFRNIRSILDLLVGTNVNVVYVTEGSLENWAKKGNVDVHLQLFRDENQVPRAYGKNYEGEKWIAIAIQDYDFTNRTPLPISGLTVTAMLDGEADNDNTNSLQVIGKVALRALKDGNNYLVITGQGVHRAVASSGWGVGLYTTHGTVSEGGKSSTVGGGGTGYASNHSITEDRPWIQAFAGIKDIPYPKENLSMIKDKKETLTVAEQKVDSPSGWRSGGK